MKDELPITDKGTLLRKRVELQYKQLIEDMYQRFIDNPEDSGSGKPSGSKLDMDPNTISNFLNLTISDLLRKKPSEIDADVNVFDQGMDSLLSIQLRNRYETEYDKAILSLF
jgi:acyl carrier protein